MLLDVFQPFFFSACICFRSIFLSSQRIPSWCDRIVFTSLRPDTLRLLDYQSRPAVRSSDHVPVVAAFRWQPAPPPPPALMLRSRTVGAGGSGGGRAEPCAIQLANLTVHRLRMAAPTAASSAADDAASKAAATSASVAGMSASASSSSSSASAAAAALASTDAAFRQLYLSFYNRAILAPASEGARTGYARVLGVDASAPGSRLTASWAAEDVPLLAGALSHPAHVCHETVFVVVRCGASDRDPSFGQAAVSLAPLAHTPAGAWAFSVDLIRHGVVCGQLTGQVSVLCD